uniref:Uncharacterized protein n=1 Tax=Candidatus Kentrum sp. TC TaxID=2126339 RepID=A0A450YCL3_9GAMM|nr:MAG: hypothetical protein BECKTC1821E_GA0114239_100476 [Candidatus Kentron sp. TC]
MPQIEKIKEETGWLKVEFALSVVIDTSVDWLDSAKLSQGACSSYSFGHLHDCRDYLGNHRYQSSRIQKDPEIGRTVMDEMLIRELLVVLAVLIFAVGMGIVIEETRDQD